MYKIYGDDVKFVNMKNKWQTLKNVPDLIKTLIKLPDDNTRYNAILNYLEPEKADIKLTKMKLVKPTKSKDIKLYELQQRKKQLEEEKAQDEETINELNDNDDDLEELLRDYHNYENDLNQMREDNYMIYLNHLNGLNLISDEMKDEIINKPASWESLETLQEAIKEAMKELKARIIKKSNEKEEKNKKEQRIKQIDKELNIIVNQINTLTAQTIENLQTETIGNLQVNSIKELNLNLKELLTKNLNDVNQIEASVINDLKNDIKDLNDKLDTEKTLIEAVNLLKPEDIEKIKKQIQDVEASYENMKNAVQTRLSDLEQSRSLLLEDKEQIEKMVNDLKTLMSTTPKNLTEDQKETLKESGVPVPQNENQSIISQVSDEQIQKIVDTTIAPLQEQITGLQGQITGFNESMKQINAFIKQRLSYEQMEQDMQTKGFMNPVNGALYELFKVIGVNDINYIYQLVNLISINVNNYQTINFHLAISEKRYIIDEQTIGQINLNDFYGCWVSLIICDNVSNIIDDILKVNTTSPNFLQYYYAKLHKEKGDKSFYSITYYNVYDKIYLYSFSLIDDVSHKNITEIKQHNIKLNELILIGQLIQSFPDYFGLQQAASRGFKDKDNIRGTNDKDKPRKPNKFIEMYDMIKVMYDKLILNQDNDELVERLKNITYSKFK